MRPEEAFKPIQGALLHLCLLFQESVDDLSFGLRLGETQCHQLNNLITRDLSYSGFVDQRGIQMIGGNFRHCADFGIIHNDSVALGMSGTAVSLYF